MAKYQDIGFTFLHLVLLTALASSSFGISHATEHRPYLFADTPSLALDSRVQWREDETAGPRCFTTHVPAAPGTWWIEVAVSAPATTPELLVFSPDDGGSTDEDPSIVQRVHAVLLEVHRPGEYVVCLTSQAPLGDVELGNAFLAKVTFKGGDPDESEPDPEP